LNLLFAFLKGEEKFNF